MLGQGGGLRRAVLAAAAVVLVIDVVAGSRWTTYDRRSQYLSELGADGAPDGVVVSVGFVLVGLLLAVAAVGAFRSGIRSWAATGVLVVAGGFAVSYAVSGIARCDPGCGEVAPISTSQQVHDVVGAAGYTAAVVGLAIAALAPGAARSGWGSGAVRWLALVAAPVVAVMGAFMADEARAADRGLHQRVAETLVFAWLVLAVPRGGGQPTVTVPTMPASAWPGTSQRIS